MPKDSQNVNAERGNILFLILIAVALFAALSYAVTSSTRGGSQDASSETNAVNAAQLSQYPSGVRTAILRMIISQSIGSDELEFDAPGDSPSATNGVFHPKAGGALPGEAQPDVMASGSKGTWLFNSQYQVFDIGTNAADNSAADIIAFLPGVKRSLCKKLNDEHGIGFSDDTDGNEIGDAKVLIANVPTEAMNQDNANPGIEDYSANHIIGADSGAGVDFKGQAFGCADFDDITSGTSDGDLVYYHVLVER